MHAEPDPIVMALRAVVDEEITEAATKIDTALKECAVAIAMARERIPSAIGDRQAVGVDFASAARALDEGTDYLNALLFIAGELHQIAAEGKPVRDAVITLISFGTCVREMEKARGIRMMASQMRDTLRAAFGGDDSGDKDG
jgi:hypothetical protein